MSDPTSDISAVDSRRLLDGLADAVVVADESNRILYVNASTEGLLGWPPGELVGRPLVTIVPEHMREAHLAGFARYLATREGRLVGGRPAQVPALRADGREITVELTLTAHGLADGRARVRTTWPSSCCACRRRAPVSRVERPRSGPSDSA